MDGEYQASTYGERIADLYDALYERMQEVAPMADFLASRSGSGRALELGIGTGRVAIPLAARGIEVHGIDASPKMVAKMRAKPGGEAIPVVIGDFAALAVQGEFSLIYVVFNTFYALLTQEAQINCLRQSAAHLDGTGAVVIEAFVPDLGRFSRNQRVAATKVNVNTLHMEASFHDLLRQQIHTHHVFISETGVRLVPVQLRYVWPSELDLMARIAGLRLRERFGGWRGEPFTADSWKHVSVFERA